MSEENTINIPIDLSSLAELLKQENEKTRELLKTLMLKPEPVKVGAIESVDEKITRFAEWMRGAKEAVSGVPSTFDFSRDVVHLPSGVAVGLREYANLQVLPRGASQAKWFKVDMPAFGALSSKTAPTTVTHTITTVTASVAERGAAQVIGYEEIEQSVVDLARMISDSFTEAAVIDEDKQILTELDTNPNVYYANDRTSENGILSTDILTLADIVKAKRKLIENLKIVPPPGSLVLVLSPKQYADLLRDANIMKAAEFGDGSPVQTGVIPSVVGIKLVVSDQVSTGTGGGTPPATTYRAHLFLPKQAFGLAIGRDLLIEAFREPPKRAITITASYLVGAKLINEKAALKVVSA
ncbi:MAG: phage capsid protein [Candidatus Caldarchaeum sp.]